MRGEGQSFITLSTRLHFIRIFYSPDAVDISLRAVIPYIFMNGDQSVMPQCSDWYYGYQGLVGEFSPAAKGMEQAAQRCLQRYLCCVFLHVQLAYPPCCPPSSCR